MKSRFEILLLFLLSLVPSLWFSEEKVVIGHDSGFRINPLIHFQNLFYSWNPLVNFGADWALNKGFLVTQIPEVFFTLVTHSMQNGQILTFIFWFFSLGLAMYIFVYSFFPQKKYWYIRIVSSLLYMYNFFVLQAWFIAERAKFSLMIALPLAILILYKMLRHEWSPLKGGILFGLLFFFFNGGSSPPLYGSIFLSSSITVLLLTAINIRKNGIKEIIYTGKIIGTTLLFSVLFNAYWVFPLVNLYIQHYSQALGATGGIEGILNWENVVNKNTSILNLFRMQGIPDWYDNPNHAYSSFFTTNPLLIILSFIPIGIILAGRTVDIRKKITKQHSILFLMFFLLLIGIVFAAGSHPPFGVFYTYLVKEVPGFAIFRSAFYKFAPTYLFALSFLSGYYLYVLLQAFVKNDLKKSTIGICAVVFILIYHFPYFTPNFFNWHESFSTRVSIPAYVNQMGEYINSTTDRDSNILLLPRNKNDFNADQYKWGFWSLDILPRLLINRPILVNDTSNNPIISEVYEVFQHQNQDGVLQLLQRTNIHYILFRNDVVGDYDQQEIEEIRNFLGENSFITLEKEFGEWTLYRVYLEEPPGVVLTPQTLLSADIESDAIGEVYDLLNLDLSTSLVINGDSSVLTSTREVIQPKECISCSHLGSQSLKEGVSIPKQRFYPGSIFYRLVEEEERNLIEQASTPTQQIDVSLSLLGKRLDEIRWLSGYDTDRFVNEMDDYNRELEILLRSIQTSVQKLSGIERVEYTNRVLAYLEKYAEDFSWVNSIDNKAKRKIEETDSILYQGIETFSDSSLLAESESEEYLYYVSPQSEEFNIYISNKTDIKGLAFNSNPILENERITLNKGLNVFHIEYVNSLQDDVLESTVLLVRPIDGKIYPSPRISFQKVNPTKYKVHVENANESFVLRFNEQFHEGWNLFSVNAERNIFQEYVSSFFSESSFYHFEIDSYANAWLVDRKGTNTFVIEYSPQKIFYGGLFVSVLSFGALTILFFKFKK